jgi:hypothetical protein
MAARCRSCGAGILWAISTASGKPIPIDPQPVDNGNVRLGRNARGEITASVLGRHEAGPGMHVSHFATCPNRDRHRRPKAPATTTSGDAS